MHQGEKLKKHLKSKDYTQKQLLEMTSFSKSKLYGLYKQNELSRDDQETLSKEFDLPQGFWGELLKDSGYSDPANEAWKEKYYALLEKYNACLEEKNDLLKDGRPKVGLPDKIVSK